MKRNLIALLLAAVFISCTTLLGCADQGPTTEAPRREDEQLLTKLNDLNRGQAALQTELEEVAKESAALRVELDDLKNRPDDIDQPKQEPSTPEPTPASRAIPIGPGICGRSPAVQSAILAVLNSPYCQVINDGELFRIVNLPHLRVPHLKSGDFEGLVNVADLRVSTITIESGAFAGLDGLEKMSLTVDSQGLIEPGSFAGLPRLENLLVTTNLASPYGRTLGPVSLPVIDSLPSLRTLVVERDLATQLMLRGSSESFFANLPSLTELEINKLNTAGSEYERGADKGPTALQVGNPFFDGLTSLERLYLGGSGSDSEYEIILAPDAFDTTPRLREVLIGGVHLRIHKDTFRHLDDLEVLQIPQELTQDGWQEHEISLSEQSPLFNMAMYRNENPHGFIIVEETTNDR